MAYIQRHLQESILQLNREYPVLLVAGPRGSGKTTMLRMLIEAGEALPDGSLDRKARLKGVKKPSKRARGYVSLDDLRERDLAKNDPALFLRLHKPPVLITEVQYAPELLPHIRAYADKYRRPGDFWLTGSHLYELMDTAYKELEKHVVLLNLFPLSAQEKAGVDYPPFMPDGSSFASQEGPVCEPEDFFESVWRGCMPHAEAGRHLDAAGEDDGASDGERWSSFYCKYLDSCIRKDVRDIGGSIDPVKFIRFFTAVAARATQVLNVKAIADEAGIDQITAKNWLGILANIGLIFYIHPFMHDALPRGIKTPKVYFYDTGLICYLTKWSSPESAFSGAFADALFENYVVSEIVKGYCHHGTPPHISYFRDRDGAEISLILDSGGVLYPVQIKYTAAPKKRMTSAFVMLEKEQIRRGDGAIICMADGIGRPGGGLLSVPARYL